ncbi:hypothetical protein PIB30_001567 [Stylosanthes scabra]|uniref:Protein DETOXIFICATION n=1 Tax=Stylosanthes scabra TaxID=79078 RepID=A0ABU6R3K2_9FABA|nr:hypothetical protein [Stylosanthes scabra]
MEAPLLGGESCGTHHHGEENDYLAVKSLKDAKFVLWNESVKLWKIALPVALSSLFQFLMTSSLNIYAGHIGDIVLSSVSVYTGVISTIYLCLQYGMASAVTTLCGQAFGAGQIQSTGIFVQKSWIALTLTSMVLLPTHIYATQILEFLGQEKDIAKIAGNYALQVIPNMFSAAISLPIQRFLQAQCKVNAIMIMSFVSLVIQNVLLYVFINAMDLGTTGLAMATNVTGWVFALALTIYASVWCKEGWNGLSWMAFRDLWAFIRLSLSVSVMTCLEQWQGNFIILLIGILPNPVIALGSYTICMNILGIYDMLLYGISIATSVRVSNTLGKSHPRAARYSLFVAMFESLFMGIVFMIVIFFIKENIAAIFTNSEDMIKAVSDLASVLAVALTIRSASQVITGVATGCGWQVMVGYINLACYYIVGLSLAYVLGFIQNLGVKVNEYLVSMPNIFFLNIQSLPLKLN